VSHYWSGRSGDSVLIQKTYIREYINVFKYNNRLLLRINANDNPVDVFVVGFVLYYKVPSRT
jgi:hypothetical protein